MRRRRGEPHIPAACALGAAPSAGSFSNNLDQDAFAAPPVELAVENSFPRSEVEPARGDRDHHLASHYLALMMRVAVILAGPVMMIALRVRVVGREPFEPSLVVLVQPRFVVVDEHG